MARMAVQLKSQTCISTVELHECDRGRARRQLTLRKSINLCPVKPRCEQVELVGSDVEAVRIGSNVRIIAKTGTVCGIWTDTVMVRSSLGSIVLDRNAV